MSYITQMVPDQESGFRISPDWISIEDAIPGRLYLVSTPFVLLSPKGRRVATNLLNERATYHIGYIHDRDVLMVLKHMEKVAKVLIGETIGCVDLSITTPGLRLHLFESMD